MKSIKVIISVFIFVVIGFNICLAASGNMHWSNPKGITVYIPKHQTSNMMKEAFEYWANLSGRKLTFSYVNNSDDAQIVVRYVNVVDTCGSEHSVGCTHYFYVKDNGEFEKVGIDIAEKMPKGTVAIGINQMLKTMRHEVGHAIGLKHNDNRSSIMYPNTATNPIIDTEYDLKSLKEIYGWK